MSDDGKRPPYDGKRPPSGVPARGYSWKPFEPGHEITKTHGGWQPAVIEEAEARAVEMIDAHAHLDLSDFLAVRAVCIAERRIERIAAWLDEMGDVDPERGELRPAVDQLRRWLSTASNLRGRIGLDPRSRAELAVDELHARRSATDLAAADLEAGRQLRQRDEAGS